MIIAYITKMFFVLISDLIHSVCFCTLDLHEGTPGGQSVGVHHAGPTTVRRLQQRRTP